MELASPCRATALEGIAHLPTYLGSYGANSIAREERGFFDVV